MQRNARFKSMYKNNIKWFDTVYKDEVKMARGVQQFMLLYHVQRTRRLREEILNAYNVEEREEAKDFSA